MCNVKSNLKKHCNGVHQMDYPTPDMHLKRIKIVPLIKCISDTFAISNDPVNSGTVPIGSAAANSDVVAVDNAAGNLNTNAVGSTLGNSDTVAIGSASCNSGTVATSVTAGMYLSNTPCSAGEIIPDETATVNSQQVATGNACLVAGKNNPGNFLLLLNDRGTSDIQHTTARRNLSLQQNLVTFVADEVSELRVEQV